MQVSRQNNKPELDTPRLPLLTGTRNVCTGSYTAEQISTKSYDLVSNRCPRQQGNSPPRIQPAFSPPRSKVRNHMGEGTKCTLLPALATLDPLLSEDAHAKASVTMQSTPSVKLPPVNEKEQRLRRRTTRLYGLVRPVREAASLEPTDSEFQEWLTLSSKETKHGDHSPDSVRSEQLSPESARSQLSPDGSGETAKHWHVLLLRKTFRQYHEQYVAACLANALGIDHSQAVEMAATAHTRKIVSLQTCDTQKAASRIGNDLRKHGILVQVTSDLGLPDLAQHKPKAPSNPILPEFDSAHSLFSSSYTELFHRAGTDRKSKTLPGNSNSRKTSSGKMHLAFSRCDLAAAMSVNEELQVCPEDPVEALFQAEKEGALEEKMFETDLDMPTRPVFRRAAHLGLKQIIKKHHRDIQETFYVGDHDVRKSGHEKSRPTITGNAQVQGDLWGSVLCAIKKDHGEDEESPKNTSNLASQKIVISPERREACIMLRFFVFGAVGNEQAATPQEKEVVFYEQLGTKDQVRQLLRIWTKLDDDDSGRVDVSEFRAFAERHFATFDDCAERIERTMNFQNAGNEAVADDREKAASIPKRATRAVPGTKGSEPLSKQITTIDLAVNSEEDLTKFIAKFIDKVAQMLLGKKSSFAIEDMMRVIWPSSELPHLKIMKNWCRDFRRAAIENRVITPPVLDNVEIEALSSVFEHFAERGEGEIHFDVLVSKGLIYEEQIDAYREEWDNDGNGHLDLFEFCEMMCPVGFRAHAQSKVGSLPDGRKVIFDEWIDGWRLETMQEVAPVEEEEKDKAMQQEHLE